MPKVNFKCVCDNECVALGISCGMTFDGTACIDEYEETTFTIYLSCGGPWTMNREIFSNYFHIIE